METILLTFRMNNPYCFFYDWIYPPGNKSRRPQKLSSVTLQEDLQLLDEVVVVGYTTIKAKRVTGAISDIRNKELMQSTATKTTSALMGKWQELQPVKHPEDQEQVQILKSETWVHLFLLLTAYKRSGTI